MSASTVSYIGANNGVDSTLDEQRALFLKLFSGEIITAFEKHTVTLDKHRVVTIQSGKSFQFPVIGNVPAAEYHVPGDELLGQKVAHGERIIPIDKMLLNHIFLGDLDEAMSHFDVRAPYSKKMGNNLAQAFDNNIFRNLVACGSASAVASLGAEGEGDIIDDANLASATDADRWTAWLSFFENAAAKLDNRFVTGERFCVIKPEDMYFLVRYSLTAPNGGLIGREVGGTGSVASGTTIYAFGLKIVASPMLPTTDYSLDTFHKVDCRNVKAIAFTEDAVGTLKLMDVSLQSQWDIRRQGTLMVARYAMGHGILQPECVVVGRSGAPA